MALVLLKPSCIRMHCWRIQVRYLSSRDSSVAAGNLFVDEDGDREAHKISTTHVSDSKSVANILVYYAHPSKDPPRSHTRYQGVDEVVV